MVGISRGDNSTFRRPRCASDPPRNFHAAVVFTEQMAGAEIPRCIVRPARTLTLALVAAVAFLALGAVRAQANVYCVAASNPTSIDPSCTPGQGKTTIADALQAAYDNAGLDTVRIGPGTFSEDNLIYFNTGGSDNGLHIIGSGKEGGPTGTTISRPNPMGNGGSVLALRAGGGETVTVSDLRVVIPANADDFTDLGIDSWNSGVSRVSVVGPSASNAVGVQFDYNYDSRSLSDFSINQPQTVGLSNYGVRVFGNHTYEIRDSSIRADFGVSASSSTVYAKRLSIEASYRGVEVSAPTNLTLESSLINLGSSPNGSGVALDSSNPAAESSGAILRSVTIVGGGTNTRGIRVNAGDGDNYAVDADSVILNGQEISVQARSTASSVAAQVDLNYSTYDPATFDVGGAVGVINQLTGNKTSASATYPAFVDAAGGDYRLSAASPLLDFGNPAFDGVLFGPVMDLVSNPRELHSDGGCAPPAARADIGAYEYLPPSPTATIDSGPAEGSYTTNNSPTFTMTSSRTCFQTFGCSVDGSTLAPCSSPFSPGILPEGQHTVEIRALGEASDPGPAATRSFTVDTVVPVTTVSGKSKFKVKGRTALASFVFGPNETGVTFTCKVVTTGYKPCAKAFKARLRPGSYKLYVIATDAAGQTDATPALKSFRVVK